MRPALPVTPAPSDLHHLATAAAGCLDTRAAWKSFLACTGRCPQPQLTNALLLWAQRPGAWLVTTAGGWRSLHREPRHSSRGVHLLAATDIGEGVSTVYDLADTTGAGVPACRWHQLARRAPADLAAALIPGSSDLTIAARTRGVAVMHNAGMPEFADDLTWLILTMLGGDLAAKDRLALHPPRQASSPPRQLAATTVAAAGRAVLRPRRSAARGTAA